MQPWLQGVFPRAAIANIVRFVMRVKRFAIAKGIITYGMELLLAIMKIVQGIAGTMYQNRGAAFSIATIPDEIFLPIESASFWDKIRDVFFVC